MMQASRKNPSLELLPLKGSFTIHRLHPDREIPGIITGFHSVTRTNDDISIVCLDEVEIDSEERSPGWKCLKVSGPLELDLVGILHDLSKPLKEAGISIFSISTYTTDYLLVPGSSYERAIEVLSTEYKIMPT